MIDGKDLHSGQLLDKQLLRSETKERPDQNLKLALLFPQSETNSLSSILGIPCTEDQLAHIKLTHNIQQTDLLKMLKSINMLGNTKGVPHLSVGGSTLESVRDISPHKKSQYQESQSSRSYIINDGLGVKGMGYVHFGENRKQTGFGLAESFIRPNNLLDIGGGVDRSNALHEQIEANELHLYSALFFGKPHYAKIFTTLPFTLGLRTISMTSEFTEPTQIILREDAIRFVPKEQLQKAIWEQLPFMFRVGKLPSASFEQDGHNAFIKSGAVKFTDYETVSQISEIPIVLLNIFQNDMNLWWFEGLRKNIPEFYRIYNLKPNEEPGQFDYTNISSELQKMIDKHIKMFGATYTDTIVSTVKQQDLRGLVRCAMAGVMLSEHIQMRNNGYTILRPLIQKLLSLEPDKQWTFYEMRRVITKHITDNTIPLFEYEDAEIPQGKLLIDTEGNLRINIPIDTYGLPIEPVVNSLITDLDLYTCWKFNKIDTAQNLTLPPEYTENPFDSLDKNILMSTVYCQVADWLTLLYHNELSTHFLDNYSNNNFRFTNENGHQIITIQQSSNHQCPLDSLHLYCGPDIQISYDLVKNEIRIQTKGNLRSKPLSEINQYAYTVHALLEFAKVNNLKGDLSVDISLT